MIWREKPAQQASGSVQHNWGVILPSGLGLPTTGLITGEKKAKNKNKNPTKPSNKKLVFLEFLVLCFLGLVPCFTYRV